MNYKNNENVNSKEALTLFLSVGVMNEKQKLTKLAIEQMHRR